MKTCQAPLYTETSNGSMPRRSRPWLYLGLGGIILILVGLTSLRQKDYRNHLFRHGHARTGQHLQSGFTIVTPTFRRPERLSTFVETYASGQIPSLRRIVIQWVDQHSEPHADLLTNISTYPVPVVIERMKSTSLNLRFKSREVVTEGILAIDDDVIFSAKDIEAGFQIWKTWGDSRRRMVGYHARTSTKQGHYGLYHVKNYSMVLTKTAFFHHDLMAEYWSSELAVVEARAFVDEGRNCEDILMSYIHARVTQTAPIYYQAGFRDLSEGKSGISTGKQHLVRRTACIQKFNGLFGQETLQYSNLAVKAL